MGVQQWTQLNRLSDLIPFQGFEDSSFHLFHFLIINNIQRLTV
jgi:hypothetical protein